MAARVLIRISAHLSSHTLSIGCFAPLGRLRQRVHAKSQDEGSASYASEAASASGRAMLEEMQMHNESIDYDGLHEGKSRAQGASTSVYYSMCKASASVKGTAGCQPGCTRPKALCSSPLRSAPRAWSS